MALFSAATRAWTAAGCEGPATTTALALLAGRQGPRGTLFEEPAGLAREVGAIGDLDRCGGLRNLGEAGPGGGGDELRELDGERGDARGRA